MHQTVASLAEPRIHKGRRVAGRATALLVTAGEGFVTRPVDELALEFEGVPGDRHRGWTRGADSRTPWYPRGAPIRNTRQVSILASDEMAEIARRMDIAEIRAEWLGANVVVDGVPRLSRLPAGTVIFFPSGATLRVEAINGPCRFAGASVAAHYPGRDGLDLLFPTAALGLRGVVASVEREGVARSGDAVTLGVPEQWVWEG